MEDSTEIPNQEGFCSVTLNVTKCLDQIWPKGSFFHSVYHTASALLHTASLLRENGY